MIGLKSEPKRVKRRDESGQALILFALGLAVLLGMAAMTIDVGLAYVARRDMQNAADAAALAGADLLLEGQSSVLAANAARDLALQNGYDNAAADVTVTINVPPTSGPHSGDSDFVEVLIEHPIDTVLARAVGVTSFDISARAVAGIDRTPKPYSIITLSETACQSMQFNGQVHLTIIDAGTLTNSECTVDAFSTNGTINVATAANHVVGGWNMTGNSGDVSLPPSRAGHFDDPLIGVPVPTPTSAPVQTCPTYGGKPGTVTLQPGVYDCTIDPPGQWGLQFEPGDYYITGGIVINGGGNVTFGQGLYFLQGEGLTITGNGVVTGDGVTFYIDEGQVTLTGTSDTQLTAPTSGTYEGIVIFQNRTLTTTVNMSGGAIADGWGAVYAAGAQIHLVGNTGSTLHQFISDTFLMSGNSNITVDYFSGFLVAVPVMSLVE
ncbi:MAG: hypothetical protein IH797_03780 [Chloroflexi bacterium]|nr:hypothetical protein [Chloroflexota bacterium]